MCTQSHSTAFAQLKRLFGLPKMLIQTRSVGQALSCLFQHAPQPRTCPCDLLLGAGVQVGKPIRCFERMPNKTEGAHMANEHGGGNGSARSTLTPKKSNAKSRRLWRRSTSRRRRQATPRPPCLARHAAGLMPIRAAAAPPAAQPGRLRFCRCFRCSLHPPFVLDLFGTRRSLSFV